ncbi:glycosyltransferase family 2 protein [Zafaria sp. J156]|uniref:glycosyltransferase family 2 protein n=1 Tax=Zafaria sp. J156 TaxID=3116490 RepID=UPI002E76E511|nr:galactosyltransferase-related protein [Zafaria sp. J156]MEE1620762.1 galactosyltransferase-related protein [Zafaria sp. J156]
MTNTSSETNVDISVVIGFKDWGLERLQLSLESLTQSFGSAAGEVVVSDYGSTQFEEGHLRRLVEDAGAVYVRTDTDGHWSRSRAVNRGFGVARGRVLVATDADMIFAPGAMENVFRALASDPGTAVVLQCRDLPEKYDHAYVRRERPSWQELELVSQIRPRWGMGGMFAASRESVASVGGYDNRMHTYGGEDLDFAQRVRRSGTSIRWIEHPKVRMYHIWHPPTIKSVEQSAAATAAVAANRAILATDMTWKRNGAAGDWNLPYARPVVRIELLQPNTDAWDSACATSVRRQSADSSTHFESTGAAVAGEGFDGGAIYVALVPGDTVLSAGAVDRLLGAVDANAPVAVAPLVDVIVSNGAAPRVVEDGSSKRDFVTILDARLLSIARPVLEASGSSLDLIRRLAVAGVAVRGIESPLGIRLQNGDLSQTAADQSLDFGLAEYSLPEELGRACGTASARELMLALVPDDYKTVDLIVSIEENEGLGDVNDLILRSAHWQLRKDLVTGQRRLTALVLDATSDECHEYESWAAEIEYSRSIGSARNVQGLASRFDESESILREVRNSTRHLPGGERCVAVAWRKLGKDGLPEPVVDGDFAERGTWSSVESSENAFVLWTEVCYSQDEALSARDLLSQLYSDGWNQGFFVPAAGPAGSELAHRWITEDGARIEA